MLLEYPVCEKGGDLKQLGKETDVWSVALVQLTSIVFNWLLLYSPRYLDQATPSTLTQKGGGLELIVASGHGQPWLLDPGNVWASLQLMHS